METLTKATKAQKDTANRLLRSYVSQGAKFSGEAYQGKNFIFRAKLHCGTIFVIVGERGAVKNSGWA